MNTKFVEVIAKILDGLYKKCSLEEINLILSKDKNLDKQTLSSAYSWVLERSLNNRLQGDKEDESNSRGIRILSEEEKDFLGIDICDYITHLINIGLLKPAEFTAIVDQLMSIPGASISKDEINLIVLYSLLGYEDNMLPGSRVHLYSSDTIN